MIKKITKIFLLVLIMSLTLTGAKSMLYAEEPTGQETTSEEPTGEEPTGEEPTGEEPTGEEPTGEEPTGEEPTGEEPTGEEPTGEEPTGEEPTGEEPTGEEPTTEEPTTEEPVSEKEPIRVLFVGNSFTRSGGTDIGKMLEKIAASQGENVKTEVIVNPGFYLSYYTNTDIGRFAFHYQLVNAIRDNKYDYIVFQESSFGCIEDVEGMCAAINKLKSYVQYYQADVKMLLYVTHPFKDGSTVEINGKETVLSIKDRLKYTHAGYTYAGNETNIKVVPAGVSFYRAKVAYPNISWYQSDKKHPEYATFFSMACSFYREIYGKQPSFTETEIKKIKLSKEEQQNIASVAYNSLEFKTTYKVLGKGEQFNLEYIFNDGKVENISFSTFDANVASVQNGLVTANNEGATAIVGRTASGSQAVCIVIVENADIKNKGISFVNKQHILEVGERIKSIPRISKMYKSDKFKWTTTSKAIAKVDEDGVVNAISAGRAKITLKNSANGKTASYYVYVRNTPPVDLKISNVISGGKVYNKITWSKSSDSTHYVIYRSTKAGSGYEKIATTNKLSYVDKSMDTNKAYYYKVTAYKNHIMCESDKSSYVKGIALGAPKLEVVAKSKKRVKMKWTKNNYATGYIIYRSQGNKKNFKKIATITSKKKVVYTDKKIKAKRNYYYAIQAYRVIGDTTFYSNKFITKKIKIPKK